MKECVVSTTLPSRTSTPTQAQMLQPNRHTFVPYPGIIATQRLHTLLLGHVPDRHGERNARLFSHSYQHDSQKDRCDVNLTTACTLYLACTAGK